jgi:hypothetical protein
MKLTLCAFYVSLVSLANAKNQSPSGNFTGIVKVACIGFNGDDLDENSLTVFAQALEESYDILDDSKKKGTYINADYICRVCSNDDNGGKPSKKPTWRPRFAIQGEDGTLEFKVDWICGDMCPGDDFLVSSFLRSTATGTTLDDVSGIRGAPIMGNENVNKWEKHLVRTLIDTRRNDFRAAESCTIAVVPGGVLSSK